MSCKLKELINKRYKKQDAVSARKIRAAYARFLRPEVIAEAQSYLQRNRETLQGIMENYCVPKEIVVSILLVETELGQHLGDRGAFNTLASMALCYPISKLSVPILRLICLPGEMKNLQGSAAARRLIGLTENSRP